MQMQVMNEQYEELIFSEPVEAFYQRVSNYTPPAAFPAPVIAQHFKVYEPAEDLQKINAARQRVAHMMVGVKRQIDNYA